MKLLNVEIQQYNLIFSIQNFGRESEKMGHKSQNQIKRLHFTI